MPRGWVPGFSVLKFPRTESKNVLRICSFDFVLKFESFIRYWPSIWSSCFGNSNILLILSWWVVLLFFYRWCTVAVPSFASSYRIWDNKTAFENWFVAGRSSINLTTTGCYCLESCELVISDLWIEAYYFFIEMCFGGLFILLFWDSRRLMVLRCIAGSLLDFCICWAGVVLYIAVCSLT